MTDDAVNQVQSLAQTLLDVVMQARHWHREYDELLATLKRIASIVDGGPEDRPSVDLADLYQRVAALRNGSYATAVAYLRDDDRYRNWWTTMRPGDPEHGYWQRGRKELADYLETVQPQ